MQKPRFSAGYTILRCLNTLPKVWDNLNIILIMLCWPDMCHFIDAQNRLLVLVSVSYLSVSSINGIRKTSFVSTEKKRKFHL